MTQPGVGSQVGPYRLVRLLGRGGFGEVYEAEDTEKGRLVALKLMSPGCSADPVFGKRLFREASTAGRLHEPHVVPIHSYGEIDGRLYIDMRLIRGEDLASVLRRGGALDPARAVWIIGQIASALDAAHAADLVHRDVKPANILLADDDFACLVDFGLANAASDTRLTSAGSTIGTLAYMAPERFVAPDQADHRADVYALACVLYECLAGATPYPATADAPTLIGAHLDAPIPRCSQIRPELAPFDDVIARGLAKDPATRFASAGELARAARDAIGGSALPPPPRAAAVTTDWPERPATTGWPGTEVPPTRIADVRDDAAATQIADAGPTQLAPTVQAPVGESVGAPKRRVLIGVLALLVVVAVVAGAGFWFLGPGKKAPAAQQTELPFTGLNHPQGIAVGADGTVYVADRESKRIVALAKGADTQKVLPFTDLAGPWGVAVDHANTVYVTDLDANKVFKVYKQLAGLTGQAELNILWDSEARGIAVNDHGEIYVANASLDHPVSKMDSTSSYALPESPVSGVVFPTGVALGPDGSLYVADGGTNRVVKVPAGSTKQEDLPFVGLLGEHMYR